MGIFSSEDKKRLLQEIRRSNEVKPRFVPTYSKVAIKKKATHPVKPPKTEKTKISPRKKKTFLKKFFLVTLSSLLILSGIFAYRVISVGKNILGGESSFWEQVKDIFSLSGKPLRGEDEGRTNFLLLGVGGEKHAGGDLADTVLVVSIKYDTHQVAMISIPRDLYVKVPGEKYYTRINAVHALGDASGKNQGPKYMKKVVEEVTGLPIHYYGRLDFPGFVKIVDEVGGIDIEIQNSFYDYWHKINFAAGTEHMNGERALAYVRARYIEGPEGGDFKRQERIQQVLMSLKNKVFSLQTAFDIRALNNIWGALGDHLSTDFDLGEAKRLYKIARDIDYNNIKSFVLNPGNGGLLISDTEILGGTPAYVLKPKAGDFSEIHNLAENIFSEESATLAVKEEKKPEEETKEEREEKPQEEKKEIKEEKPTIEVRNGTSINGLAKRTAEKLDQANFDILSIGNAANRNYHTTLIIDLTGGEKPQSLKETQKVVSGTVQEELPEGEKESKAGFVIILGTDAAE